jgi:hypothetical protein
MPRAVQYCAKRSLPPRLTSRIKAHFEFQHQKSASGVDKIFAQMPLTLKVKVASARYYNQVLAIAIPSALLPNARA